MFKRLLSDLIARVRVRAPAPTMPAPQAAIPTRHNHVKSTAMPVVSSVVCRGFRR